MSTTNLSKLIPKAMQTDFWVQFMDACSDEIELLKSEMALKVDTFNIRNLTTITELQNVSTTFGYTPNLSLDSSVAFFKSEINAITYKIKRKTTYPGYNYVFKTIPILGFVYNLFWDDTALIRALDFTSINLALTTYNFSDVITWVNPDLYYSTIQNTPLTLDDGLILDDGILLDTSILKEVTHHLAIEIIPEILTTVSAVDYLMTNEYMDYISYYVNYNRKCTENPHIGVQLGMVTDNSRFYNNLNNLSYTVPALKAKFAVTQDYSVTTKNHMFYKILAGIGTRTMWSNSEVPGTITSLSDQIYSRILSSNESEDTGGYYKIFTYVPNETVQNYLVFIGDGSTTSDSGTNKFGNIIPKSYYLTYFANNQEITLQDDGLGNIESSTFVGTLNYTTGDFVFNFVNTVDNVETFSGGVSSLSVTLAFNTIVQESVVLEYTYHSQVYLATFNSSGSLVSGSWISSASITYGGALNVTFSVTLDSDLIKCSYSFDNFSIPQLGYDVTVSYKTTDPVEITEIGIEDDTGQLVAYGVIPPCYMPDRENFYISLNLFIKQ